MALEEKEGYVIIKMHLNDRDGNFFFVEKYMPIEDYMRSQKKESTVREEKPTKKKSAKKKSTFTSLF